jgi:hypothetical protein
MKRKPSLLVIFLSSSLTSSASWQFKHYGTLGINQSPANFQQTKRVEQKAVAG